MESLAMMLSLKVLQKNFSSFIIGLCLGIALSLIQTPFENDCSKNASLDEASSRLFKNIRDIRSNSQMDGDDYELRFRVDAEEPEANKNFKYSKLFRPRYYATELNVKYKIMAVVMTSVDTFDTFGPVVNRTLCGYVSNIIFLMADSSKDLKTQLHVISFHNSVNYLNIFRYASYVFEKFGNQYDYFYFTVDKTYTHGRELLETLEGISVREDVHFGSLNSHDSPFCSLESGLVVSGSVLKKTYASVEYCSHNFAFGSPSENIGRCIVDATQVPCTSALMGKNFATFSLHGIHDLEYYLSVIPQDSTLGQAITVTGLENPSNVLLLHHFFTQGDVAKASSNIVELRSLLSSRSLPPLYEEDKVWPWGSFAPQVPPSRFDVIPWIFYNGSHIMPKGDFQNVDVDSEYQKKDLEDVIHASVRLIQEQYGTYYSFIKINWAHLRFDPSRGMDYKLHLTFFSSETRMEVIKRIDAFRPLLHSEIVPVPFKAENERVVVVIPVEEDDVPNAVELLERLHTDAGVFNVHVYMIFIYPYGWSLSTTHKNFKVLSHMLSDFTAEHPKNSIKGSFQTLMSGKDLPSVFEIVNLVVSKVPEESVILLAYPGDRFNLDFLNRVRMNTVKNCQVFCPIPFVTYHPDIVSDVTGQEKFIINRNLGKFDAQSEERMSFYIEDYLEAHQRKKDAAENGIKMYTRTATTIYQMFKQFTTLHILKAVEPEIKVPYQDVVCKNFSSQENELCQLQEGFSMGMRTQLSHVVIAYKEASHLIKEGFFG